MMAMEPIDGDKTWVIEEEPRFSLELYRRAQEAQAQGRHWHSAVLFSLSIHALHGDVHPNALYQVAWSLACLREWELSSVALRILFRQTPLHNAGRHVWESLELMGIEPDQPVPLDPKRTARLEHATFRSPKELRRIAQAAIAAESE